MMQCRKGSYKTDIKSKYLEDCLKMHFMIDIRDPALTFVVSGSSSLLLESESAESLAGRLDMLRLAPPDFIFHAV